MLDCNSLYVYVLTKRKPKFRVLKFKKDDASSSVQKSYKFQAAHLINRIHGIQRQGGGQYRDRIWK